MSAEVGTPNPDSSFNWKCVICNLGFTQKGALLHHLQTPDHRANIPTEDPNPYPEPVPQTPKLEPEPAVVAPQTSVLSASASLPLKLEDLKEVIRQMIRENLTRIVQEELQTAFSPYYQQNVSSTNLLIH
ncbi:unnamed protein product [Dibothriocephalus latus]|uniref:C2H2-type domain-containing protein n=1 Tax=Dibothriocephalus latus TaxID=60516 RepID=A0A3P7N3C7_DIBLA|nr:unnamed protein product [Dibothriocephalus latus]